MLTISKPLSASQARTYHAREFAAQEQNYWSRDQQGHSEWQGRLADLEIVGDLKTVPSFSLDATVCARVASVPCHARPGCQTLMIVRPIANATAMLMPQMANIFAPCRPVMWVLTKASRIAKKISGVASAVRS